MRLLQYIKEKHKNLTNRIIKRALEQGACLVNGKIERYASRQIDPKKDKIDFTYIKPEAKAKLVIEKSRIVFEDDYILVYNKAAGHPIMATEGNKGPNLHAELKRFGNYKFLSPAHRLDKLTSGLVLFAKTKEALTELARQFKAKEIQKEYEALLDGKWKHRKQGKISNFLKLKQKLGTSQIWQVVEKPSPSAKDAITEYELIKIYDKYTHILLKPLTGRTHQLRVHMAFMGHPILGDTIYAESFRSGIILNRHILHAANLELNHPITKKRLRLKAPRPEDLEKLLK